MLSLPTKTCPEDTVRTPPRRRDVIGKDADPLGGEKRYRERRHDELKKALQQP
jgi:hypothetical protein